MGTLHRLAAARGAWLDVHDLWEGRRETGNRRKSIREALGRMVDEVRAVSPECGAALGALRVLVDTDGRVKARLLARTHGLFIRTA